MCSSSWGNDGRFPIFFHNPSCCWKPTSLASHIQGHTSGGRKMGVHAAVTFLGGLVEAKAWPCWTRKHIYKPPDFWGGRSVPSILVSCSLGKKKCMILYVWCVCVCVCFSQRFALWNVFWFFVQQLGLNPMDLFCRQPLRLITAKLPWKPTKKRSETNFIHV